MLAPGGHARDKSTDEIPRIGYLVLSPLGDTPSPERAGFLGGLRELGYEDGKNIFIEYRSANGDPEVLPFLAEELVDRKVKAIVGAGFQAIQAARQTSRTVPIVMMLAADPVDLGFVHSLAHPGSNVTGMALMSTELGPKRLQILKTVLPTLRQVVIIWDSTNPGMSPKWAAIKSAAHELNVHVSGIDLSSIKNPDTLRQQLAAKRPGAILTIISPQVSRYRTELPRIARELRIPTMFDWETFVLEGGLMSYVASFPDVARRSATYVDKILRGASPAELPIEQPTTILLTLNLDTARVIGIRFPQDVLLRADRVIE